MSRGPSFTPPIRSSPSNQSGPLSLRVIIDKKALAEAGKKIDEDVRQSAKGIALELSHRAIEFLARADAGVGHRYLAQRWTNTRPVVGSDGSVSIEVFNAAETELFYTKSNAPNSKYRYPISGKRLLNILLNGAAEHTISARSASNPLQFPITRGERQSRFAGSSFLAGGFGVASFLQNRSPDGFVKGGIVHHPGVVPNRFLQAAKQHVEAVAAAEGDAIASKVAVRINSGKIGETF